VGLRGGQWRRQLLEEQFHEAAGTSYSDAQASGFEIVPDDIVVKSFLQHKDTVDPFDFKPFPVRSLFQLLCRRFLVDLFSIIVPTIKSSGILVE